MKVPYLGVKRKSEMTQLIEEFRQKIAQHLAIASKDKRLDEPWLRSMYPVLALLQILNSGGFTLNPSREYALLGAQDVGDEDTFLEAINSFQASESVLRAMQRAHKATIFTGFISELRSDLLLVLVQGLICSYRGSAVGLRCALEDLYRHLYYMDHPQEFSALASGQSEYGMGINPKFFREYLRRTSYLAPLHGGCLDFSKKSTAEDVDWFGQNESLYADLSAAVHGASGNWFAAVSTADSLKHIDSKSAKLDFLFVGFAKLCVAVLIAAHRDVFSSINDYDKSIVLELFGAEERANFRLLFNI